MPILWASPTWADDLIDYADRTEADLRHHPECDRQRVHLHRECMGTTCGCGATCPCAPPWITQLPPRPAR